MHLSIMYILNASSITCHHWWLVSSMFQCSLWAEYTLESRSVSVVCHISLRCHAFKHLQHRLRNQVQIYPIGICILLGLLHKLQWLYRDITAKSHSRSWFWVLDTLQPNCLALMLSYYGLWWLWLTWLIRVAWPTETRQQWWTLCWAASR